MTDSRGLFERASRGDGRALQSLLVRHLPSLEAYVRLKAGRLVSAKETPSDLLQSVCYEVLKDTSGFEYRGESAFRNWLFKRALHKIMNKQRHYKRQKRDVSREVRLADECSADSVSGNPESLMECYATICTPSRVAMGHEAVAAFEKAFASLKEDHREAITLYRVVGMSYLEIAKEMGRTEGAVRNLVYRGLARLSTLLDDS